MGIIRTSLLIMAVAVMLPSPPEIRQLYSQKKTEVAPTTHAVGTALNSVVDLKPICAKQEDVCDTAGYLLERLEAKARYNFGLLYDWARSDGAEAASPLANQASADPILTGSAAKVSSRKTSSHNTLRLDDLIPAWRGPGQSTEI
jgi:hypothetical protein